MKKPKRFYAEEFEFKEDRRRAPVITEEIKEIRKRSPILEDMDYEELEYNLKMKKGGSIKKVKKAYLGKAIRQPTETDKEFEMRHEYHTPFKGPQKASLGALIGIGADNLLKNSETARSLTKNLGIAGQLVGSYYDKKSSSKDKTTGAEQTKQVTAKQMGGMVRGGRAEIKGTRPAKLT